MILAFIILVVHLSGLRSFGVPYLTPLAPSVREELGDTIVRRPLWGYKKRPKMISGGNKVGQGENQKPQPPETRTMKNSADEKGD